MPVTAASCGLSDLGGWADRATTSELAAVRAARSGPRAVLLGSGLPVVPGSTRYWGHTVYLPVGYRAHPDLPVDVLREAVGAATGEMVFFDLAGVEVIHAEVFEPVTRAGVRLAILELSQTEPDRP